MAGSSCCLQPRAPQDTWWLRQEWVREYYPLISSCETEVICISVREENYPSTHWKTCSVYVSPGLPTAKCLAVLSWHVGWARSHLEQCDFHDLSAPISSFLPRFPLCSFTWLQTWPSLSQRAGSQQYSPGDLAKVLGFFNWFWASVCFNFLIKTCYC